MSQEADPNPKCPTRPPPLDPLRVQSLRRSRLTRAEEIQADAYDPPLQSRNIPKYIEVLPDESPVKNNVAPPRPPPPVVKRPHLSQSTETQDLNGHEETTYTRYVCHKWSDEATAKLPACCDVLPDESSPKEADPKPNCPTRPPPPDPLRVQSLRRSRLTRAEEIQADAYDPPLQSRNIPKYIEVLPDESPVKNNVAPPRPPPPVLQRPHLSQSTETQDLNSHAETTDTRYIETAGHNGSDEAAADDRTYIEVLPDNSSPTTHTIPENVPPPPPHHPVNSSQLSLVPPKKTSLCQSRSAEPTGHIYESIDNILSQNNNQPRGISTGLARKGRPPTYHSWTERSSMDHNSTERELDILLEWWRSIGGLENLPVDHQKEETVTKPLISVAQRVKTAMRLYELLLIQRCTDLLNLVTELHCTADSLVRSSRKTRFAKLTGGTTSAVGGVAIAAGIALAPLTLGASLVATGVGIGIVAAGGVTGASASATKKKKGNKIKDKVERILNNFKSQIEDILACLRFIEIWMKHLRQQEEAKLKELGEPLEKIARVAQKMESINPIELSGILEDLDSYFYDEDDSRSPKITNSQLVEKIHEIADKLKECVDQLLWIKKIVSFSK